MLIFRNEIERNRRKVMEINFFLDNQQIEFENLMTEVRGNTEERVYTIDELDELSTIEEKLEGKIEEFVDESVEKVDESNEKNEDNN